MGRRRIITIGVISALAVATLLAPRLWDRVRDERARQALSDGQSMAIPGTDSVQLGSFPKPEYRSNPKHAGPPYVTSVSPDGRYFLDQYERPILVRGDSPWSLLTRLSPDQARLWFSDRKARGFNAAIVSLIGAVANGAPDDSGRTVDGLLPFTGGDIMQWEEAYWNRVRDYLGMAADSGITVFLYPIDGWTIGHSFRPKSSDQCRDYGAKLGNYLKESPNLVWVSGGDYFPNPQDPARGSDVDICIDAMMRGVRSTGDGHPFSMQFGYPKANSTDNEFWSSRVDWNFVYTYNPTYRAVLDAYGWQPPVPVLMGEANYERENNQENSPPTTDETLRRQVLWALTSGAAGDFMGSDDWEFHPGWEKRLDTPAVGLIGRLRDLFTRLPWWQLQPDVDETFVTAGRGTKLTADDPMDVLDNDYVTAARTPDGGTAVVYLPTKRTITIDRSKLAAGTQAFWVDPVSGDRTPIPVATRLATPGTNAGGDHDWLLLFTPTGPAV